MGFAFVPKLVSRVLRSGIINCNDVSDFAISFIEHDLSVLSHFLQHQIQFVNQVLFIGSLGLNSMGKSLD